jgi:Bax inhibitor 1
VALASSALGAYLHVVCNIGGMLTMLGCMGTIAWLFSVPVYEEVRLSFLLQVDLHNLIYRSYRRNLTTGKDKSFLCADVFALPCRVCVCVQRKRYGLLMAAALLEGASVGPLIKFAVDFDPR